MDGGRRMEGRQMEGRGWSLKHRGSGAKTKLRATARDYSTTVSSKALLYCTYIVSAPDARHARIRGTLLLLEVHINYFAQSFWIKPELPTTIANDLAKLAVELPTVITVIKI